MTKEDINFDQLPKVIAIVGSRFFTRLDWVDTFVNRLPKGTIVVSGGAQGVDTQAKETAKKRGLRYKPFHIEGWEWEMLGKAVAAIRNEAIVRFVKRFRGRVFIFAMTVNGELEEKSGSLMVKELCEQLHVPFTIFGVEK